MKTRLMLLCLVGVLVLPLSALQQVVTIEGTLDILVADYPNGTSETFYAVETGTEAPGAASGLVAR